MKNLAILFISLFFISCSNIEQSKEIDLIAREYAIATDYSSTLNELKTSLKILKQKNFIKRYRIYDDFNTILKGWAYIEMDNKETYIIRNVLPKTNQLVISKAEFGIHSMSRPAERSSYADYYKKPFNMTVEEFTRFLISKRYKN